MQGPPGLPVPLRLNGSKGDTGQKGAQGPIGKQGLQGEKGEPGVKGDTGANGTFGRKKIHTHVILNVIRIFCFTGCM